MSLFKDIPTFPGYGLFDGHFRQGRKIFSIHYGDPSFVAKMPTPSEARPPSHGSLDGEFRHPTWNNVSMPYFMFLPRYNPFHGPLFRRLNYTNKSLPLTSNNGGWRLAPSVLDEWSQLESVMRSIIDAMHQILVNRDCDFAGAIYFGFPSQFGYKIPRRNRQAALAVAMRSPDAFLPLMAFITMRLLLFEDFDDELSVSA
ncbi:hypothetical protein B0H13DRAFT_2388955 [Mycena leptocephala]|nr:hypothetical protein B0H13DRAFT_2388955 [Mycena leptocephala]